MARNKSETRRTAEKTLKKTHSLTLVLAFFFLVIGCVGGVAASVIFTKNDYFVLKGDEVVLVAVGGEYEEKGASAVSFGKDISDKIVRGGDLKYLDTDIEGIYQIVYSVEDFRWSDYRLVRTVVVGNPEGAEEFIKQTEGRAND